MSKFFIRHAAAAALLLFVVSGCKSDAPAEDMTSVVPEAVNDPSGFNSSSLDSSSEGAWKTTTSDISSENANGNGWVLADPSGNRLGMPVIYFAYDSDLLVPSETDNLDKIASYMSDKPKLALVIEGHCDQRGTDEYNRALGERRANAIRAYLAEHGIADSRMSTVSFGKDKPAVDGSGESVWSQNRRGVPVPMVMP